MIIIFAVLNILIRIVLETVFKDIQEVKYEWV